MARILSDAEMIELTGYQVAGKQLEALRAMGLRPMIRADGRPRVTDDALTQAMLGNFPSREPTAANCAPDWSKLRATG